MFKNVLIVFFQRKWKTECCEKNIKRDLHENFGKVEISEVCLFINSNERPNLSKEKSSIFDFKLHICIHIQLFGMMMERLLQQRLQT